MTKDENKCCLKENKKQATRTSIIDQRYSLHNWVFLFQKFILSLSLFLNPPRPFQQTSTLRAMTLISPVSSLTTAYQSTSNGSSFTTSLFSSGSSTSWSDLVTWPSRKRLRPTIGRSTRRTMFHSLLLVDHSTDPWGEERSLLSPL